MGKLAGHESSHKDLTTLDAVIKETVRTLETGRKQAFAVSENARNEYTRLSEALIEIDGQLEKVNTELVLALEKEKDSHSRITVVTDNFEKHTENEIKAAYDESRKVQVKLTMLRERRNQLEHKKSDLEKSRLNLKETVEKAEGMVSQVGVVMDFIRGNLKDINIKLESIHQRQQMGLQIVRAQEEERKRVAREIHDGPAQSMANVVLRVEFCERLLDAEPERVKSELSEIKQVVRNNLQDVRKIIFDLRPMALDDLGVVPALKRYIEDFREKNDLIVIMKFFGRETRLEPALEIAMFRLVQEALNNVAKHSMADRAEVSLEIRDEWVKVTVEDNGIGFDLDEFLNQQKKTNFGLISMKERVELLGGEIDIDTKKGQGTKVFFRIPVTGGG